jgi:hypothetical protein
MNHCCISTHDNLGFIFSVAFLPFLLLLARGVSKKHLSLGSYGHYTVARPCFGTVVPTLAHIVSQPDATFLN